MQKKGLAGSEIFAYLIVVLIVGVIFVIGFQFISSETNTIDKSEAHRFHTKISSDVQLVGREQGRFKKLDYEIPRGIDEICILDLDKSDKILSSIFINHYPEIKDSLESNARKNVFFVGDEGGNSVYVDDIKINHFPHMHCFDDMEELGLEGVGGGDVALLADFLVETNIDSSRDTTLSADKFATIIVPEGTTSDNNRIFIEMISPIRTSNSRYTDFYRFGPEGTSFNPNILVEFKYDYVGCPSKLSFYQFSDAGVFKKVIDSKNIDCANKIVTFEFDSFSFGFVGDHCDQNDPCATNSPLILGGNQLTIDSFGNSNFFSGQQGSPNVALDSGTNSNVAADQTAAANSNLPGQQDNSGASNQDVRAPFTAREMEICSALLFEILDERVNAIIAHNQQMESQVQGYIARQWPKLIKVNPSTCDGYIEYWPRMFNSFHEPLIEVTNYWFRHDLLRDSWQQQIIDAGKDNEAFLMVFRVGNAHHEDLYTDRTVCSGWSPHINGPLGLGSGEWRQCSPTFFLNTCKKRMTAFDSNPNWHQRAYCGPSITNTPQIEVDAPYRDLSQITLTQITKNYDTKGFSDASAARDTN